MTNVDLVLKAEMENLRLSIVTMIHNHHGIMEVCDIPTSLKAKPFR